MPHYLIGFIGGWLTTALLLVIEHLLWEGTSRQVRYLLGTGAVCVGCSVAGIILENVALIGMPWAIASAGLVILAIYWFEGLAEAAKQAAQKNGEIIGTAKGLRNELMKDHDAQSGLDKTRSRN